MQSLKKSKKISFYIDVDVNTNYQWRCPKITKVETPLKNQYVLDIFRYFFPNAFVG